MGAQPRSNLTALAVVPARIGSTRLPRKMLLAETGHPLFEHTVRRVEQSGAFDRIVLATDSPEIVEAAEAVGVEALMTSADHRSGTDRVNEAVEQLEAAGGSWDVVVNVQGDEAELPSADLAVLLSGFSDPAVELATLAAPLSGPEELADPHVVKVVWDARGDALYFSRAPIPASVDGGAAPPERAGHHVGVYAFRPDALARFCALPPGVLERAESLEQLRWLEAGFAIRVQSASRHSGGIDTEEDYRAFVERARSQGSLQGQPTP